MACFVVPAGEAIVTTIVQKVIEKKERKAGGEEAPKMGLKWSRRLGWLNKMLWGGTLMLVFEHIWNGEIILQPPFLTAMATPAGMATMVREIATIGVGMAVVVTIVWGIIVVIAELKAKAVPAAKANPASRGE